MNRKASLKIAIPIILGVILLVLALFYFAEPEKKAEVKVIDLGIDVKACSSIDKDFNCINEKTEFNSGSDIWFLINAKNLKSKDLVLSYKQERVIISPDGKIIASVSGLQLDENKEVDKDGYYNIPIRNQLKTTNEIMKGAYKVGIKITDNNENKYIIQETGFIIK